MPQTRPADDRRVVPVSRRPAGNQLLALVLALLLVVTGVAGLAVTDGGSWTVHDPGHTVLGLSVNRLHAALHVVLGGIGLVLWRRPGGVRGYGLLLAVLLGLVLVYGLLATGRSWDALNLDQEGNLLHLAVAVSGVAVAAWPRPHRRRRSAPADDSP